MISWLFALNYIFISSHATPAYAEDKKTIDIGSAELDGQNRNPMVDSLDGEKIYRQLLERTAAVEFKKFEAEMLKP